jgi:membrane-associated phospholipid phosphatase
MALLASWVIAGLALTVEGHERWRLYARAWVYGIAVMLSSGITIQILKVVIGRYRPRLLFDGGIYGFEPFSGANSFPSGHSQVIFSVAMSLWFIYPRYRLAYMVAAVLIAASRMATTVHFLSDTIMGATIAILYALWLREKFEGGGGAPVSLQALAGQHRRGAATKPPPS